jgi:hypothetical protein
MHPDAVLVEAQTPSRYFAASERYVVLSACHSLAERISGPVAAQSSRRISARRVLGQWMACLNSDHAAYTFYVRPRVQP